MSINVTRPTPMFLRGIQLRQSSLRQDSSNLESLDRLSENSPPDSSEWKNQEALRRYAMNGGKDKVCPIKSSANLSSELLKRLDDLGISTTEFDGLQDQQKKCLLNILAGLDNAGLALKGLQVARKDGQLDLDQERVHFTASKSDFSNFENQVRNRNFSPNKFKEHNGIRESYRQKTSQDSLQIGFGQDGKTIDIDIDPNNPQKGPFPFIKHAKNVVIDHKTDPEKVGDHRYWETDCSQN